MVVLYLILPLVFYSLVTGVIALTLPLQALMCTLLGAAVTFPVLYYWPYRFDQARRGVMPPIPFRFQGCLPILILLGIGICLSVNNMISLTPLPEWSPGFEEVGEALYSPPFLIQILGAGLVIPAAEEMIFRGLMFAPLRDRMAFWPAALISAALFGLYHGNLLQGVYAFLLGLVMAWLYERFQTLAAPWVFHAAANVTSIVIVNTGLRNAEGIYYKVVDSDDWVDEAAYQEILSTLRRFVCGEETLDMLISNFVYEKQGAKRKKVMNYRTALPQNELFTWDDVKVFMLGQYILMHSVIYRTELLRECGLELPKHTFYVDNIFVYQPLPHVKTMYYLNVNFYRYFIGREDQSVNEEVMIGRIDQQIRVTKLMLGYCDVTKLKKRKLRRYMVRYLEIMMTVSSILAIKSGTEENMAKKKELWQYLRKLNLTLYLRLRWGFLGQGTNLPGKSGRKFSIAGYKITQKFFGFN